MEDTVFYSWQSDNAKTRRHVESALNAAVASINEDPSVEVAPRVDKDTQNTAGAVHIVDTIKKKIDSCAIFLADVSLVDTAASGRSIVNQNVMFELGYAIGKHSESRVIMVANSDLGDIKNLPFDISHHRVIQFSPTSDKKGVKLQASLESAISIHLDSLAKEKRHLESTTDKEKLLTAINEKKPTRSIATKYFDNLYQRYLEHSPGRYKGGNIQHYGAEVYDAYSSTKDLTVELHAVLETAAEHSQGDVLIRAYKSLSSISQYYDVMPEDNGQMYERSKDYHVLVVNEIVSLILGSATHEKLWDVMQEVHNAKLNRPDTYGDSRTLERLHGYPESALNHYQEVKNQKYVIPMTPLIQERFSDNKAILQTYLDGSLLRYFMVNTFPWPVGLLLGSSWNQYVPDFLSDFKKASFTDALRNITGEPTLDEFRINIWKQASQDLGNWSYPQDNLLESFSYAGIQKQEDIASER